MRTIVLHSSRPWLRGAGRGRPAQVTIVRSFSDEVPRMPARLSARWVSRCYAMMQHIARPQLHPANVTMPGSQVKLHPWQR